MARTSDALVGGIILVDAKIPLAPFIDAANSLVTDLCTGSSYSDAKLALIETWLAAHFYAIRDPRRASEGVGEISARIESKVDLALNVTRYGQMAMTLDTAGNLANVSKQAAEGNIVASAGVTWLGSDLYD